MKNIIQTVNNLLNLINEDKFAKYTTQQIYDELGEEGFIDYMEEISYKAIKNVLPNQEFKILSRRQKGETVWLGFNCETIPDKYVVIRETFSTTFDFNHMTRGIGYGISVAYLVSIVHKKPNGNVASKPLATHYPIIEYIKDVDVNVSNGIKELVKNIYSAPTAKKIRNKFEKLNSEINQSYEK
jgi:hypothetical protein